MDASQNFGSPDVYFTEKFQSVLSKNLSIIQLWRCENIYNCDHRAVIVIVKLIT